MTDRIFVCRCEDVTVKEIEHAQSLGLETVEEIKRYTGVGTGPCQGKECMATLARRLVVQGGASRQALQPFTSRPPLEPVTFASLAAARDADDPEAAP